MTIVLLNTNRRAQTLFRTFPTSAGSVVFDAGDVTLDDDELLVTLDAVDLDVTIPTDDLVAIVDDIDYDVTLDDDDQVVTLDDDDLDVELDC